MDDQRTHREEGLDAARPRDDDDQPDHQLIWASHARVKPALVYEPPAQRPPRDWSILKDLGIVLFLVAAVGAGIVTWNAVGRATSSAFARAPETPSPSATLAASASAASPSAAPSGRDAVVATPAVSPSPTAAATAAPSPTAKPVRKAVNVDVVAKPAAVFVTEKRKTWCAAAAVQIVLNINGKRPDTSFARQSQIHDMEVQYTDRADSRNGGTGPEGMVATLNRLGKVDYELGVFKTRSSALRASAKAIAKTGRPVILLAWRGAHSWVMSGYKANADPAVFSNAVVKGAYILDPWYPRVSSIWGPSDGPGVYQDNAEMIRNYLPWRRPEGHYPGRDGRFLAILPVVP